MFSVVFQLLRKVFALVLYKELIEVLCFLYLGRFKCLFFDSYSILISPTIYSERVFYGRDHFLIRFRNSSS